MGIGSLKRYKGSQNKQSYNLQQADVKVGAVLVHRHLVYTVLSQYKWGRQTFVKMRCGDPALRWKVEFDRDYVMRNFNKVV